MIPIIILAAGASSRMRGRDKLLEDVDGQPLLARQIAMAQTVGDDIRVALPPPPHARHAVVAQTPVQPITVADAQEGMSASIRTAFASLDADVDRAMLLLGDLPELTADDLRMVIDACQTAPNALIWRGATEDGRGGHPIIFDRALFQQLCRLKGDEGGQSVARAAADRVHLVPLPGNRARRDLDTPEDWAAWRAAQKST